MILLLYFMKLIEKGDNLTQSILLHFERLCAIILDGGEA